MEDRLMAGVERLEAAALLRRAELCGARALLLEARARRHLERAEELDGMGLPVFRNWLLDRAEELAWTRLRLVKEAFLIRRRVKMFHVEQPGLEPEG